MQRPSPLWEWGAAPKARAPFKVHTATNKRIRTMGTRFIVDNNSELLSQPKNEKENLSGDVIAISSICHLRPTPSAFEFFPLLSENRYRTRPMSEWTILETSHRKPTVRPRPTRSPLSIYQRGLRARTLIDRVFWLPPCLVSPSASVFDPTFFHSLISRFQMTISSKMTTIEVSLLPIS